MCDKQRHHAYLWCVKNYQTVEFYIENALLKGVTLDFCHYFVSCLTEMHIFRDFDGKIARLALFWCRPRDKRGAEQYVNATCRANSLTHQAYEAAQLTRSPCCSS